MEKLTRIGGTGLLLVAEAFVFGSTAVAYQGSQAPPAAYELQARTLEDGSETFDTLIRSQNGLFIYGCIRKPPGQGPFPGVILVHGGLGGTQAATRNLALQSTPAQALVKRGYAILSTDYRSGDWTSEYQDVISAYEHFKQLPYVRADAVGMMGGSRGGKLTLDVVTRVQLQAAVPCAGPYDLGRYYEYCRTSEFHRKLRQLAEGGGVRTFMSEVVEQFGGTPDQVGERYWENSGISRVGNVQTPVLVVHGERDLVVHPAMSRELASALRKHGKVVEEHFAADVSQSFYWGFPVLRGDATERFAEEVECLGQATKPFGCQGHLVCCRDELGTGFCCKQLNPLYFMNINCAQPLSDTPL